MGKNFWGYVFAGVSALSGILYLYQSRNATTQQSVTNVFPPLNTSDPVPSTSTDDPLPTDTAPMTGSEANSPNLQPWPVYIV